MKILVLIDLDIHGVVERIRVGAFPVDLSDETGGLVFILALERTDVLEFLAFSGLFMAVFPDKAALVVDGEYGFLTCFIHIVIGFRGKGAVKGFSVHGKVCLGGGHGDQSVLILLIEAVVGIFSAAQVIGIVEGHGNTIAFFFIVDGNVSAFGCPVGLKLFAAVGLCKRVALRQCGGTGDQGCGHHCDGRDNTKKFLHSL